MDLYYKTVRGSVSCCYSDLCNDGSSAVGLYPTKQFSSQLSPPALGESAGGEGGLVSHPSIPGGLAATFQPEEEVGSLSHREGNCEKYFEKINTDEWVPDILVPLAFDRASESKVGVFYTKLGERTGNNDHVVVRILNKNKQNLTMYSVKLFR